MLDLQEKGDSEDYFEQNFPATQTQKDSFPKLNFLGMLQNYSKAIDPERKQDSDQKSLK